MSTPKKTVMLEISIACSEAMNSGGVYAFFERLAAICDPPLTARLLTAIDNANGKMSLAKVRPTKLDGAGAWWLQRLCAEDWETEVREDALLKSYMDGVRQFRTSPGRHTLALTTLLESVCPLFKEFVRRVDVPEQVIADLRGASAEHDMHVPCYRFPGIVQARICWENVYGPTEWPGGMDLAEAQYDEDRATVKAALDALVEQRDLDKWDVKRKHAADVQWHSSRK